MIPRIPRFASGLFVIFCLTGCPDGYVGDSATQADTGDAVVSDADAAETGSSDTELHLDSESVDGTADVDEQPDGGRSVTRESWEVSSGDIIRNVHVVRPESVPAAPTVWVFLHGCFQTGEDFASSIGAGDLASKYGTVALFPSQDYGVNPQGCWRWYSDAQREPLNSEAALVPEAFEEAESRLGVDTDRAYLTGFSAGGGLASIVAGCFPDILDGVAIHSGLEFAAADSAWEAQEVMSSPSQARDPEVAGERALECGARGASSTPMVIIHGTKDDTVDPGHAERTARQFLQTRDLRDDGMDNDTKNWIHADETRRQIDGRDVTERTFDETPLKMLLIDGLDHAYAGGTGLYGEPGAPDATAYAREFFR